MKSLVQTLRKDSFSRNSLILFIGSMLANVLNYVFHFVIGRMVSIPVYGEAESLISLINLVSVPAAAITMVATKYGSMGKAERSGEATRAVLRDLQIKIASIGIPLFILAIIVTPYVRSFLHLSSALALYLLWTLVLVSFFSAVNLGVMGGWQKFTESSIASVLGGMVKLVAVIMFLLAGFAVNGIIGSFLLGGIAMYLASVYLLKFLGRETALEDEDQQEDKERYTGKLARLPKLTNYLFPVLIANLALTILGNIDVVFAKHNLDPITAGEYGAISVVAKIIFFGTGAIASVLFAMAAEKKHQESDSFGLFLKAAMLTGIIAVLSTLIYFAIPKFLLWVLYGKTYLSVAPYLGWLAIAVSLYSFSNLAIQYLLSIHETRAAYMYLTSAILGSAFIWVFGKTIESLLSMVLLAQALSAAVCLAVILIKVRSRNSAIRSAIPIPVLEPEFEPITPTI